MHFQWNFFYKEMKQLYHTNNVEMKFHQETKVIYFITRGDNYEKESITGNPSIKAIQDI